MKLDLLIKEIQDPVVKENTLRLQRELQAQQILDGQFVFFEVEILAGNVLFPIKHNLNFVPRDIVFLSVEGDHNIYFNYEYFNAKNIYVTCAGPCRIRFLAGNFAGKAYGGSRTEFPFVPPSSGGGGGGTGTTWLTGVGSPTGGIGSVGDFYLNTSNKQIYLKTGIATWSLQGDLLDTPFATVEDTFIVNEPTISALKLVYTDTANSVKLGDSSLLSTANLLGVTKTAGISGAPINILTYGPLVDASFIWAANTLLYLGLNGTITSTAPAVGFHVRVGHALGIGKIFISINEPITL